MSVVALTAGLHSAFGSSATAPPALDWSAETIAFEPLDRRATVDLAGHLLPLPTLPVGRPAPADAAPADIRLAEAITRTDEDRPDERAAQSAVASVVAAIVPVRDPPAALLSTEAAVVGRSTAEWFATPADPVLDAQPVLDAEHVVVQRGDTLLQILLRSGIDRAEAHEVVGTLSTVYDPRRLRVGQAMAVEVERAGDALAAPRLAALSLNLDFGNDLRVERDANGEFAARRVDRELVQSVHAAHAVIDASLYQTARRHAVPDEALVNLANIFSWDIDFQRDVHPGDSFELVYERVESPDGEVRGGEVLFASLSLRGRHVHAYRFEHADGTRGYYDADGRSLRKWLMRTPIDGARLSSGFGPRRHPILGYNRMHRGVDFAAPTGTPIYAAGDGVLTQVGRNGAYGNYIQIRHNDEFTTAYAHMSRFAEGIKKGGRVRQGQVIAYVGTTGRSTGPHLHYEVLQNGSQINPMSIKPQTASRLTGAEFERFRRQIETIDAKRPTADSATRLAQR
jgi:murein DD-endopeptidase MepM/ murein hydrolase activator NlpD